MTDGSLTAAEAGLEGLGLGWRLGLVGLLVLANGFFVAAEFALVAVRRSKVDQMVEAGDRGARVVQAALQRLDRYISGTQLGITLASLALGWIGEPALASLIDGILSSLGIVTPPAVAHSAASITVAFLIITFLHIVLGELAPKSLALSRPEGVSKWVARPLMAFSWLASPAIWVLNGAAKALLRLFRIQPVSELEHVHSADELRLMVVNAAEHGRLNREDSAMLAGVFDFHDKKARDVMRPRTEVVAIAEEASEAEVQAILRAERYSRYPVYRTSLDDVAGVFLAKDLWLAAEGKPFVLSEHVRQAPYVPDSRPAESVLSDLRRSRAQMAIVLDEYGGTAGIVTLEDLIEQVIGDIDDEYDVARRPSIETNGVLELDGAMTLADARSGYGLEIPRGDWSTVGGYVFGELGRLARMGDRVPITTGELEVVAMQGRRVAAVRVHARRTPPGGQVAADSPRADGEASL